MKKVVLMAMVFLSGTVISAQAQQGFGCRHHGTELEFYLNQELASVAIGKATPLFGAAVQGWTNDVPMKLEKGVFVVRVPAGPFYTKGYPQEWGFWAYKNGPWGPGVVYQKGIPENRKFFKPTPAYTYNFVTVCEEVE